MPKRNLAPPLLLVGACALGAAAFVGGFLLRGSTDPRARIARSGPDRYVASLDDRQAIPLGDFYAAMTDLLKKEYVEPISDDRKLASGAVRGMVLSLGDPRCAFMDRDEFRAFLNAREGRYEGIGVELGYQGKAAAKPKPKDPDEEPTDDPREAILASRVPYLTVTMVVPGGPADRAGVRVGDTVAGVDGHWVPDAVEIARFNQARLDFDAKKIPYSTVARLLADLKKKVERALMPAKAKDRLVLGTSGTVTVAWKRDGASRTTKIPKAPSAVSPFAVKDGAYTLRFDTEAAPRLRAALRGKTEIVLDLRNNVDGDFDSMCEALAVLAPNGAYGSLTTHRREPATPLTVRDGNPRPPRLTLRVDETTQGPAAILARALASRRLGTLQGTPGTDLSVREVYRLPDGAGYTLVVGEYTPGHVAGGKVALKEDAS